MMEMLWRIHCFASSKLLIALLTGCNKASRRDIFLQSFRYQKQLQIPFYQKMAGQLDSNLAAGQTPLPRLQASIPNIE